MSRSIIWFRKERSRGNQFCPYCGISVGSDSSVASNEEHLIGRNFVPKGTMENSFNFSFRACAECNSRKSRLEDHVSSLTLLNTPSIELNELAREAAERKALRSFHPEKRVPMGKAREQQKIEFQLGPATVKFGLVAPSRPAGDYIPELAYYHVQGLFSLVTTLEEPSTAPCRILPPDQFRVFDHYSYSDWGNAQLNEIIRRTADVPCRATICSGEGHFRACLRRCPDQGWFWALEWNKSLRIVGAICHSFERCSWFENLSLLSWSRMPDGSLIRSEAAEPDEGDVLFPPDLIPHPDGRTQ